MTQEAPAPVPGAVDTIIAQTAHAAATQTALKVTPTLTPTDTSVPTKTPTVTPSDTPTFLFLLSTFTFTPEPATVAAGAGDYACALTAQTPDDGATIGKKQTFSASWTVRNTGTLTWDANNTDFVYVSGAKLTSLKVADLPKSVATGETVTLKLTLEAPNQADTYKTVWILHSGKDDFCRLDITIVVQ